MQTKLGRVRPSVLSIVKSSVISHVVWEAYQRECKCARRVNVGQHSDRTSIFLIPLPPAGVVSGDPEPQPKARPDSTGPGAGLLPGNRPAESTRHPLQERVRVEIQQGQKALLRGVKLSNFIDIALFM